MKRDDRLHYDKPYQPGDQPICKLGESYEDKQDIETKDIGGGGDSGLPAEDQPEQLPDTPEEKENKKASEIETVIKCKLCDMILDRQSAEMINRKINRALTMDASNTDILNNNITPEQLAKKIYEKCPLCRQILTEISKVVLIGYQSSITEWLYKDEENTDILHFGDAR
jgi:hypothetical protein